MNLSELKQKVMRKEIDNLYIFSGEEFGIMEKYVNSISKVLGKGKKRLDSVKEVFQASSIMSLMNKDNLYIVRDDKDFAQSKSEKKWPELEKIKNKNIILVFSNLDKRGKFYKRYKNRIIEFERLSVKQLVNYVYKEINLKSDYAEQLVIFCGNDYSRLMLEIDKIKNLMEVKKCDASVAYLTLINEGQIYKTPSALVFDLSDAVLMRDEKFAFKVLNTLKQLKTNHVLMLSIIYLGYRNMLLYQASKAQGISSGLNGYIAKCLSNKAGRYSTGKLIENLKIIQRAELRLKQGKIDPDVAAEFILLQVL